MPGVKQEMKHDPLTIESKTILIEQEFHVELLMFTNTVMKERKIQMSTSETLEYIANKTAI